MGLFHEIYKAIYIIGIYTYRYGRRFFTRLARLVKKPLSMLFAVLYTLYIAADTFLLSAFHEAADDWRELKTDMGRARKNLQAGKHAPAALPRALVGYIGKARERHRTALRYAFNCLLPVLALAVLLMAVRYCASMTFALSVSYDGREIGYVQSEDVLRGAGEKAAALLNSGIETVTAAEITHKTSYTIAAVKPSELCSEGYVADCIVNSARGDYTDACAVYINGTLLCLVKSESDAVFAFDKLLSERRGGKKDATVSFVEDIEFKECLYPKDKATFLSAKELYDTVSAVKTTAKTYTIKRSDDPDDILELFDNSADLLYRLNPGIESFTEPGTVLILTPAINRLSTKLTFTSERTVTKKHDTVKIESDALYSGAKKVIQQGVDGKTRITELVTYIDGVLTESTELKKTVITETVDEIVKIGTQTKPSGYVGPYTIATTSGRFIWPVVGLYTVYSWFGWRSLGNHKGIDISGGHASGALIVAAESGTVVFAGRDNSGYGNYVIIRHSDGVQTLYGHCLDGSLMVKAGDNVSAGQAIGRVGNTGYSFGAHLHFEVRVNGTAVDPASYLGLY